jgi:hypothetical protein
LAWTSLDLPTAARSRNNCAKKKRGVVLGDSIFAVFFAFFAADVLGFVGSGGLLRAAGGRLGVDLWGIGHSFGGSDF